ncbi:GTPase ObgE [Mesomycoplasma lagogenitalium]|uniref:GTPase Obg n=1 Tax=Mesomycoplasma lagogenitalium TaxID=171286 RepID=A0ABY8LTW3_9BACT|nr:GTPase ObgE [Mesomycoplasma lagogenitalium]WGI36681.1 GTPase ObgE [Mesomycoplasma lagogenitalium]
MKFIDEVKIKVEAGKGGNGIIAFRREAHVDRGGPDGGDGGNGGSIFFVGDSGVNTLLHLYLKKIIKGNDGENGRRKNQYGAAGEDIYIKVPIGTLVYDGDKLLCDVIKEEPYLIAKGGKGGRGNAKFKSSRNTAPKISENGDFGQKFNLTLNLKVLADVGFVGKPSAGKSTILSKISNAKPKIAEYHFTTLVPQLGLVRVFENSFVAADLPGLIKNASLGKGLGTQFLKHIERCKIIAHIIDFGDETKDPINDYLEINNELKSYNLSLEKRKQIIVANKSDSLFFQNKLKIFKKKFPNEKIVEISALENNNIDTLKIELWNAIKNEKSPIFEKTFSEVTITLEKYHEVKKIHEGLYEVYGPEIEEIYNKIPIVSHDNLMRFNYKLKELGVWNQLLDLGIASGDVVRIYEYEFVWEDEI